MVGFHLSEVSKQVFRRYHKDRKWDGGCQRLGGEENQSYLMGLEFQFGKMKKVLEMDGGDGYATM